MNDERRGIEVLRDAVERVASDIESTTTAGRRPTVWPLAAAAALLLLLTGVAIWTRLAPERPAGLAEVEVVEWKIRGESVRADVIENDDTGTILVVPRRPEASGQTGVAVMVWGEMR